MKAKQEQEPLGYSVAQAAAMLNVHPRTIRRAIKKGELKSYKVLDKLLVLRASIEAKIKSRKSEVAS